MAVVLSTWRKDRITLTSAAIYEYTINTVYWGKQVVQPNIFVIQSKNTTDIVYVSNLASVSSTDYLMSVNPLTFHRHVVTTPVTKFYIICASGCQLDISYGYDPEPSASDYEGTQNITIVNQALTLGNVGITSIAAGDNNIGNVDIVTLPALAAGTNTIGGVKVVDEGGTNKLKVNADGSIDANWTGTVSATTVTIEDSDTDELAINANGSINVAVLSIAAGDNNIGNVDIVSMPNVTVGSLPTLPAGDNNIGNVDIVTVAAGQNIKPSTTPVIYNVTCASAATEYSQALPSNCHKFTIGIASKNSSVTWVLKFGTGGAEFSFNGTESYSIDNLLLASQTLYFESDTDGEIIQIIAYS
jgi:hypothetical protein